MLDALVLPRKDITPEEMERGRRLQKRSLAITAVVVILVIAAVSLGVSGWPVSIGLGLAATACSVAMAIVDRRRS